MNKLYLLIFLFIATPALAWNSEGGTNYYTAEQIHSVDFLGKIFPDKPKHVDEWDGRVNRHVLSKADYERDPQVLISSPRVEAKVLPEPEVIEKIVYVEREKEPEIIVKTRWEYDE